MKLPYRFVFYTLFVCFFLRLSLYIKYEKFLNLHIYVFYFTYQYCTHCQYMYKIFSYTTAWLLYNKYLYNFHCEYTELIIPLATIFDLISF